MTTDVTTAPASKVSFIREEHELSKLSKNIRKLNTKALAVLEDSLSDEDPKIRMEAAKTLLKMDIDISKIINEDAMNRIIAELKVNGDVKEIKSNNTPLIDFNNGNIRHSTLAADKPWISNMVINAQDAFTFKSAN